MKKLAKFITVSAALLLSGAAVGLVGCQKPHSHVYGAYQSAGEEGHRRPAVCQGHQDVFSPVVPHNYGGGSGTVCLDCGYCKTPDTSNKDDTDLTRADALIIEGIPQKEINLTESYTSHSVDGSAVFVYLSLNGEKISEKALSDEDITLTLTDPTGGVVDDWTNLRVHGTYTITATAKIGEAELTGSQKIYINNPVLPQTLEVKKGAVLSQPKSRKDYMTASWQYEISRQNGDKVDVDASSVKIVGLDTYTEKTGATATLHSGEYSGTVTYDIVNNPDIHTLRYALDFDALNEGELADGTSLFNGGGTEIKVNCEQGGASVFREVTETKDRYFRSYLQFDGGLLITSAAETAVEYCYAEGDSVTTCRLTVPENGTCTLSGNIKLFYFDVTVTVEDKNAEDIGLPEVGEELIKLEVSAKTENFMQTFVSGDIFYISPEYTVNGTYVGGIFGEKLETEVTDGLKYYLNGEEVTPDLTVLTAERFHDFGQVEITVGCGGLSAVYLAYLQRPPVTGVDGVSVKMPDGFETSVFDETETLTLTPDLFKTEVFGSVPSEVIIERVVCRPVNGNGFLEVEESGLNIGVGDYEIYVTVKIVQGYAEETVTEIYPLSVTVDDSLKNIYADASLLLTGNITQTTLIHSGRSGSVYVTATARNAVKCESYGDGGFTSAVNLGGAGSIDYRSIKFCVRAECVITVTLSSRDYAEIIFADADGIISEKETEGGELLTTLQFTAPSAGEFYLYAKNKAVSFYAAEIDYSSDYRQ